MGAESLAGAGRQAVQGDPGLERQAGSAAGDPVRPDRRVTPTLVSRRAGFPMGGSKRWIAPFRDAFPDVHMEIVDLIAEADRVVGRFTCSATRRGTWRGYPPTGRRFDRVNEVYIFRIRDGKIVHVWGLEDDLERMRQLGLA
ncbi:MAG: hypothetical protein GEV03_27705 [Streptosporangiales bacterium]|nr:hypothetical protein [Streptosporangiales bacterium]